MGRRWLPWLVGTGRILSRQVLGLVFFGFWFALELQPVLKAPCSSQLQKPAPPPW